MPLSAIQSSFFTQQAYFSLQNLLCRVADGRHDLAEDGRLGGGEAIVRQLEQGNAPLDESLKLFQEGTKLVQSCAKQLDSAEQEIVKLTKTADGTPAETEYVRDE